MSIWPSVVALCALAWWGQGHLMTNGEKGEKGWLNFVWGTLGEGLEEGTSGAQA